MWDLRQFTIVIIVGLSIPAGGSPFKNLVNKFDNIEEIIEIFITVLDLMESHNNDSQYLSYKTDICDDFNSLVPENTLKLIYVVKKLSFIHEMITKQLNEALLAGEEFLTITSAILEKVDDKLRELNEIYNPLITLKWELIQSDLKEVVLTNFDENSTEFEVKVDKILSEIHVELFENAVEKNLFRQILEKNSFNSVECSYYELLQNQLYYSYLRLVSAEIQTFFRLTFRYYFINGGKYFANLDELEKLASNSVFRITNYIQLVRNTIEKVSVNCDCAENAVIEVKTNPLGIIDQFYPISSSRVLTVFTNITHNICVHLSSNLSMENIPIFEICLGDALNTQDVVRKYDEVIYTKDIKNSNRFAEPKFRKFIFNLTGNLLTVSHEKSQLQYDILLELDEDFYLQYMTHCALTSPHIREYAVWYITNAPVLPSGFSEIIKGIKSCWCKVKNINDFTNITDISNVALSMRRSKENSKIQKPFDNFFCITYTPDETKLHGLIFFDGKKYCCGGYSGKSDSGYVGNDEKSMVLGGCKPSLIRDDHAVSSHSWTSISLVDDEVVFFEFCAYSDTNDEDIFGIYRTNFKKCRSLFYNYSTSDFKIIAF